uniref:Uncharacterized protein n=1 Tax=Candidatus Kentrum sp. FW TaxID=2126338 RepID=A0A450T2P6_9GAMM|nr:MAG: hypothetical protein BECKFW1821A_GA0114235_10053 [Candidatus Kentron sp. FW]VFJ60810.1 MAG: hypothetical protein BECKFW1821B_GA0114236_10603 [Candidatus Kentron sp. FW]
MESAKPRHTALQYLSLVARHHGIWIGVEKPILARRLSPIYKQTCWYSGLHDVILASIATQRAQRGRTKFRRHRGRLRISKQLLTHRLERNALSPPQYRSPNIMMVLWSACGMVISRFSRVPTRSKFR